MYLAKVTGTVVATVKAAGLDGVRLLVVEAVDDDGRLSGKPAVAADAVQAGVGDLVFVVTGREGALALDETFVPVDLAVAGHVDDVFHSASVEAPRHDSRDTNPRADATAPTPTARRAPRAPRNVAPPASPRRGRKR